jgi:hypothetical protein
MSAAAIADAVEGRLRADHVGEVTLFRRELGICVGAGRVDVAAVNGCLTGCEVKSSRDGLGRLAGQVELYGRVVDYAVLAVERSRPQLLLRRLPSWWGVWHVTRTTEGEACLEVLREASRNPDVQPFAVAQLLWRDEAFGVLRERSLHRGLASATRWRLWEVIANELPLDDLREVVRVRLRARREW